MTVLSLTFSSLCKGFKNRSFSVTEVIKAYLHQIEKTNHLNAYLQITADQALQKAKESDKRWLKGEALSLDGFPLAIKDAFCTQGVTTTASSRILKNFIPPYESTVTQKIMDQGAIMLGKTNLDEFCMGSTTTPSFTGPSFNPWNRECTAGGSSGGSAVAVASGAALGALGTDTGGSIRQPAALCGIVGVRPTYGRCSRWGMIAYASSLDQAGPMARCVEDAALLLEAMAGHDPQDATSSRRPVPPFSKAIGKSIQGFKVGIIKELYEQPNLDEATVALWEDGKKMLEDAGCEIHMVSMPYVAYALPCYYILACAEAASNLRRYDGVKYGYRTDSYTSLEEMYHKTRGEGFGPEVKRRILIGTYVLSHGYYDAYYGKAQKVRSLIQQEFRRVFEDVSLLMSPTTPRSAFPLASAPKDPVEMYYNDVLTVPVNVGNTCALSVPAGLCPQGLPLGLQIMAPSFEEERLFQTAHIIEQSVSFPSSPFLRA